METVKFDLQPIEKYFDQCGVDSPLNLQSNIELITEQFLKMLALLNENEIKFKFTDTMAEAIIDLNFFAKEFLSEVQERSELVNSNA